jgi:hypothetical protein
MKEINNELSIREHRAPHLPGHHSGTHKTSTVAGECPGPMFTGNPADPNQDVAAAGTTSSIMTQHTHQACP